MSICSEKRQDLGPWSRGQCLQVIVGGLSNNARTDSGCFHTTLAATATERGGILGLCQAMAEDMMGPPPTVEGAFEQGMKDVIDDL